MKTARKNTKITRMARTIVTTLLLVSGTQAYAFDLSKSPFLAKLIAPVAAAGKGAGEALNKLGAYLTEKPVEKLITSVALVGSTVTKHLAAAETQLASFAQEHIKNHPWLVGLGTCGLGAGLYAAYRCASGSPRDTLKIPEEFAKYTRIFDQTPDGFKQDVLNYAQKKIEESNRLDAEGKSAFGLIRHNDLVEINESVVKARKFVLEALAQKYDFETYQIARGPWLYLTHASPDNPLMKGKREGVSLRDRGKREPVGFRDKLAGNYKIHLMPRDKDIVAVVTRVLQTLRNNTALQDVIAEIKIQIDPPARYTGIRNEDIKPHIVIYPATGKEHAQQALNILHGILKDVAGLGITPRYNKRVTSLIYIAQGDGDDKNNYSYNNYYEQPEKVYYASNFTGTNQNHHLKIPH